MNRWTRKAARTIAYLIGFPEPAPPATAPKPVSWLAAVRSAVVCVSLGTALFGVFLVRDDPNVRHDDQHALWGIGAWLGGLLSLAVLLSGRDPQKARHTGGAMLIGFYGFGAGMFIGRSLAGASLALWLQLGVAAGIGVAVVMAAIAVTHLPAWRRNRDTPDPKPTEAQA